MYKVSSGLERYKYNKATPTEKNKDEEIIKQQNNELCQLKESYMRLRDQFQMDKSSSQMKLLSLQNELKAEQRRVEKLEDQMNELVQKNSAFEYNGKSVKVVEGIWEVLKTYRNKVSQLKTPKRGKDDINFNDLENVDRFQSPLSFPRKNQYKESSDDDIFFFGCGKSPLETPDQMKERKAENSKDSLIKRKKM